jgi:hypothetical protein
MTWLDKTLARMGLQRVTVAQPIPLPAMPGEVRPPRKHFEYFITPLADGFDWSARAYLFETVNTANGAPVYMPFVEETNGVSSTERIARETAIAWGKQMTGEAK